MEFGAPPLIKHLLRVLKHNKRGYGLQNLNVT
jgi:hypothetical protein